MSEDPRDPQPDLSQPKAAPPAPWTTLAHLLRPQGRKGEVLAELLTDFPDRFGTQPEVFLAPPDFRGAPADARAATVSNHWLPVGRNHGRVVLAFAGVESIEQAEALAGLDVIVADSDRLALEDDAEYISDLVGCTVFDHTVTPPISIGVVTGVDFPLAPDGSRRLPDAAPLLSVETAEGDEILIPYVQAFLVELAVVQRRIDMRLPAGLLDLNRESLPGDTEEPGPA